MRLKPDSRALGRGALGDAIDGRSREGKFIRRIEAELLDQLGANPSFAQLLLVRRAARARRQIGGVAECVSPAGELRTLPCCLRSNDPRRQSGLYGFSAAWLIKSV